MAKKNYKNIIEIELDGAIEDAKRVLASAAQDAAHAIAVAASDALKVKTETTNTDHDLLTRLDEKVNQLIISMKLLADKDSTYCTSEDFKFWRNLLVSAFGFTMAMLIGIIIRLAMK